MKIEALILTLLAVSPADAESLLHPMFADHAVLQREQPIHIYGQAPPGTAIEVQLANSATETRANASGQWMATLPAMAGGGPYTLKVSGGGTTQQASDVLVGDVFLCAGQSNMQLSVRRAANADAEIAAAINGEVREFAVDRLASPVPLDRFSSPVTWKVESPQTAGDFSATCFYFARELRKHEKVPIGLVTAAWGGTRDRGWVSEASLRALGYYNTDLDLLTLYRRDLTLPPI